MNDLDLCLNVVSNVVGYVTPTVLVVFVLNATLICSLIIIIIIIIIITIISKTHWYDYRPILVAEEETYIVASSVTNTSSLIVSLKHVVCAVF